MQILHQLVPQPSWAPDATPHISWGEYYVQIGTEHVPNAFGPPEMPIYESVTIPAEYFNKCVEPKYLVVNGVGAWYWVREDEG